MSAKNDKKMRKMFRNEIKGTLQKLTQDTYETGELYNNKPAWCPQWLWEKLKAIVVNEVFRTNYEIIQKRLSKKGVTEEAEEGSEQEATDTHN